MGIITISRGSYSMGKSVAEKVAARLDYKVISRDLLLDASDRFHVPYAKLQKALHDAPGPLERYQHTKQVYIAFIRSTLLDIVGTDNVVYHGLAGHLLLKGLNNVLKVRIIANLNSRISRKMTEEGISEQKAREIILKDDAQRKKWTRKIYGTDPTDSSLYDMVLCIDRLSVDDAVDFICQAASTPAFRTTDETLRKRQDLAVACSVKTTFVEAFPDVAVSCDYGNVLLYATEKDAHSGKFKKIMETLQKEQQGIFNLEVHSGTSIPEDAV